MSSQEQDKHIEELEDEQLEDQTIDEDDEGTCAQGESLYNSLKEQGLVDDPWTDLADSEKKKYQLVASDCGM